MATIASFEDRAKTAAGVKAIQTFANYEANKGSGLLKAMRGLFTTFSADDAEKVFDLVAQRAAIIKAGGNKGAIGTVARTVPAGTHVSAAKGLWKAYEWKSWPAFLDQLEGYDPSYADIVYLCTWFRGTDKAGKKLNWDKARTDPPTMDAARAHLKARDDAQRAAKAAARARAAGSTSEPKVEVVTGAELVRTKPAAAMHNVLALLKDMEAIESDKKAKAYLVNALKALDGYAPFVVERQKQAILAASAANAANEAAAMLAGK